MSYIISIKKIEEVSAKETKFNLIPEFISSETYEELDYNERKYYDIVKDADENKKYTRSRPCPVEVITTKEVTKEIYTQQVDSLDIVSVIAAVNKVYDHD